MPRESFVVDAALLHELGERLIGRPAIALGELVKNAFDADATVCRIQFGDDQIVVSDNGTGMSDEDFVRHWMRIATTHKVDQRVSKRFKRPLTGAKGIGRLSAHFLADRLTLESTPHGASANGLRAEVDWTSAVSGRELSTVQVDWEKRSGTSAYPGDSVSGTTITLAGLKNEWDKKAIEELGNDVWILRSPFRPSSRGARGQGPDDFTIEIEAPTVAGAREAFDRTLSIVFDNWKARIRGTVERGRSNEPASISVEFQKGYPDGSRQARQFQQKVRIPIRPESENDPGPLVDRVSFEILIFKPEGRQPGGISVGDLRAYLAKFGNVSVYDAGFRLPYYGSQRDEVGEDWLAIAADQGRRLNQSDLLPEHLRTQTKYMQDLPAPGRIFGAVDINTSHETRAAKKARRKARVHLEIQSARDRLHDNLAFQQLRDLVRFSLDYYANRFRAISLDVVERQRSTEPASKKYKRAIDLLEASKQKIPATVFQAVKRELKDAAKTTKVEELAADRRAALLAPLASAGMAALALNHEIARESNFLGKLGNRLRSLAKKHGVAELGEIAQELQAAQGRLDSIRELFAPLLSDADKSATDRLRVGPVVEQTLGAMKALMPGITFSPRAIPSDLRFPVGSLSEWNALLQNVLANAWNAMLESSRRVVGVTGGRDDSGQEWLRISDSGVGLDVPLSEAAALFEPFERRLKIGRDKESIAIGGQGLGLAIVRMIAQRRGADVSFVEPVGDFSTTFQLSWKGTK